MFESILDNNVNAGALSFIDGGICLAVSAILGAIIALVHMFTSKYSKNFIITLAVLPVLVQLVIMMVNGNLGTSIAIMGAFSLVRFRSIAGNSKEILSVFFAMVVGLAVGMGHVLFAFVATIFVGLLIIIYSFAMNKTKSTDENRLKIVIPENLNFTNIFDDIFEKYTNENKLEKVKTTNMGSMYELTYLIKLKDKAETKKLIDELRCRNGNLNIILSLTNEGELEL